MFCSAERTGEFSRIVGKMSAPIRSTVFKNVKTFPLLRFPQKDKSSITLLISHMHPLLEQWPFGIAYAKNDSPREWDIAAGNISSWNMEKVG
jgi:hypothetical protein